MTKQLIIKGYWLFCTACQARHIHMPDELNRPCCAFCGAVWMPMKEEEQQANG